MIYWSTILVSGIALIALAAILGYWFTMLGLTILILCKGAYHETKGYLNKFILDYRFWRFKRKRFRSSFYES